MSTQTEEKAGKAAYEVAVDLEELRTAEWTLDQSEAVLKATESKIDHLLYDGDMLLGVAIEKAVALKERMDGLYAKKDAEVQPPE